MSVVVAYLPVRLQQENHDSLHIFCDITPFSYKIWRVQQDNICLIFDSFALNTTGDITTCICREDKIQYPTVEVSGYRKRQQTSNCVSEEDHGVM